MVLWTLVTIGYVAPALVGGIGLGHTGDVATRLGGVRRSHDLIMVTQGRRRSEPK